MPRIDRQPGFFGRLCRLYKRHDCRFPIGGKSRGIGAGVEFDAVGTDFGGTEDQVGFRTDKQTRTDACGCETGEDLCQEGGLGAGIPTCVGGQYARWVGDEGDLFRLYLQNEIYEIRRRIAFDVELRGRDLAQGPHVCVGDVARIGPRVHRDAVRPPLLDALSCSDGAGPFTAPCIAQGGNFVDVDAQARWESFHGPSGVVQLQTANFAKSPFMGATKSMHAGSIINDELIALNPGDTLEKALRAMDELKVEHLPVAAEGRYLGLVAEEHLLDKEGEAVFLTNVQLMPVMVAPEQHFLEVVDVLCEADVSVVPVVEDGMLLGCTDRTYLWRAFHHSLTPYNEGSILTLEMPWKDYSLAQVSHRVESEGVKILQVLVSDGQQPENAEVALRLSTRNIEALIDSLRRHGYDVRAFYRAEEYAEEMKRRMAAFMRYMNI